jgi:hypothetical protein
MLIFPNNPYGIPVPIRKSMNLRLISLELRRLLKSRSCVVPRQFSIYTLAGIFNIGERLRRDFSLYKTTHRASPLSLECKPVCKRNFDFRLKGQDEFGNSSLR